MKTLIPLLVLTFGLYGSIQAQEKETEPAAPALPDIAPREVEIRGQLTISFPSLERQPLIGFNPPPRIYRIPPDRIPIIHPYRQPLASLPHSSLRKPSTPATQASLPMTPKHSYLRLAAGRYLSRDVQFLYEQPLGKQVAFITELTYTGSNGHRPFADSTLAQWRRVRAPYDSFDGRTGFRYHRGSTALEITLSGLSRKYPVWGTLPDTSGAQPQRNGYSLKPEVRFKTQWSTYLHLNASIALSVSKYTTDVPHVPPSPALRYTENLAEASLHMRIPLLHTAIEAYGGTGTINRSAWFGRDYQAGHLQLATTPTRVRNLQATAGAALLYTSGTSGRRYAYLTPTFQLTYALTHTLQLLVQQHPEVQLQSLPALLEINPYTLLRTTSPDAPVFDPTLYVWDASAGIQWQRGGFRLQVMTGFKQSPNWPIWQVTQLPGFFTMRPYRARLTFLKIAGALVTARRLKTYAQLQIQTGRVQATQTLPEGSVIPYLAPVSFTLESEIPLWSGKGILALETQLLSRRPTTFANDTFLPATGLLNTSLSYYITSRWGLRLQAQNVTPGQLLWWQGYPEATNILKLGAFLNW